MKRSGFVLLAAFLALPFFVESASAYDIDENNKIYGLGQLWLITGEDAVSGSDITDKDGVVGPDTTFGFKAKRLRFGLQGRTASGVVFYNIMLDTASGSAQLVDYWFGLNMMEGALEFQVGQFRPFLTNTTSNKASALPNIERAEGFKNVGAAFYFDNALFRDRGAALRFGMVDGIADVTLSITNGAGAADTGGDTSKGSIYANGEGDAAYVFSVVSKPAPGWRLTAGYGVNTHNQTVLSGADSAINIDRTIMSVGGKVSFPTAGVWVDGEYALFESGEGDSKYFGAKEEVYFGRVGVVITPNVIDIVTRYSVDTDNGIKQGTKDSGFVTNQLSVTGNFYLGDEFKIQGEYQSIEPEEGDASTTMRIAFHAKF